jgi:hypothetical protein
MMSRPTIHADFNNADPRGRLRLNGVGSIEDLSRQGIQLREGLQMTLHDKELEADGEAHYSAEEQIWVVTINWDLVRQTRA